MQQAARTWAYIDGFNFYYGIVRRTRSHWLDLSEFARQVNGGDAVDRVVYCTAMVSATRGDSGGPNRQQAYHNALHVACPSVEILKGSFARPPAR